MTDTRTLEEQLAHCDGRDCECAGGSENECACDADWTPAEVYRLRAQMNSGATKRRDEIALAILPAVYAAAMADWRDGPDGSIDKHWREGLALDAYAMADAMIAMRNAKVTPDTGGNHD